MDSTATSEFRHRLIWLPTSSSATITSINLPLSSKKLKLVEVIKGIATSDVTTSRTVALAEALGKVPVTANDRAGFVSNRVLMPMINEAFYAWMEGVAEPEAIDDIMKLGCNFPMGPLRLADFIGLDVCHDIMMVLSTELGQDKYFPCPLLRQLVRAGRLGDKTGHGVYDHSA